MIHEVYPSVYQLEIPLPNNPLRAIHCYVIRGKERNLLVDTGFDIQEGREAWAYAMKELSLNPENTDLYITHLHSDHCGLAAYMASLGMRVLSGTVDGHLINQMTQRSYWEKFDQLSVLMGMAEDAIAFDDHPGYKYCPKTPLDFIYLNEGDLLSYEHFTFKVLDIPGHTPGHTALWDESKHILFSGDHILDRITPNIGFWGFESDILAIYFASLEKIRRMEVEWVFSSHRNLLQNPNDRIEALIQHHHHRLNEILDILKLGELTVRAVAAGMKWDLRGITWEQFPNNQKWFAAGEALSHLEHLYATGKVKKEERNGILYYGLCPA